MYTCKTVSQECKYGFYGRLLTKNSSLLRFKIDKKELGEIFRWEKIVPSGRNFCSSSLISTQFCGGGFHGLRSVTLSMLRVLLNVWAFRGDRRGGVPK